MNNKIYIIFYFYKYLFKNSKKFIGKKEKFFILVVIWFDCYIIFIFIVFIIFFISLVGYEFIRVVIRSWIFLVKKSKI